MITLIDLFSQHEFNSPVTQVQITRFVILLLLSKNQGSRSSSSFLLKRDKSRKKHSDVKYCFRFPGISRACVHADARFYEVKNCDGTGCDVFLEIAFHPR